MSEPKKVWERSYPPIPRKFGALQPENFVDLVRVATEDLKDWQDSTYFNFKDQKKHVDMDVRGSQFHDLQEYPLLETHMSESLRGIGFLLVPLDFHVLRYKEGGLFAKHRDHVQCPEANGLEHTFLLMIQPAQKGGELRIFKNDEDATGAPLVMQPNNLILFDKTILHSVDKVIEGTKYVLKGTAIKLDAANHVVVVFLPKEQKYFVLPVNKLPRRCSYAVEYRNRRAKRGTTPLHGILYTELHRDSAYVLSLNKAFRQKSTLTRRCQRRDEDEIADGGPDEEDGNELGNSEDDDENNCSIS